MKNKYVQTTGGLSGLAVSEFDGVIQSILQKVGDYGVQVMREKTQPFDDTGNMTNSIMWRTASAQSVNGASAEASDIDPPEEPNAVLIGSASDYAYWREYGAGPHVTNYRSAEFIASLKDWCRSKLGFEPNDPSNIGRFRNLLKSVRRHLDSHSYAAASFEEIVKYAKKESLRGVVRFWDDKKKEAQNVGW